MKTPSVSVGPFAFIMRTGFIAAATLFASFNCLCPAHAQDLFSQTLTPGVTLLGSQPQVGSNRLVLTFSATPWPLDDGMFTLTATGDINGPPDDKEYVLVSGEDGRLLGTLFDGFNGVPAPITDTGSLTIPLSLLARFAVDGNVQITLEAARGVSGVTIDSATLTYQSAELVPCSGLSPGQRWKNHAQYVSAVIETVDELVDEGLLTDKEGAKIIAAAARSDCGKK